MSESKNPSGISQSNTGSMAGGMQAFVGDKNQQVMSTHTISTDKRITKNDVIQLIVELEEAIISSKLSDKDKKIINTYLAPVKEELQEQEPDKNLIQVGLDNLTKKINKLSKTFDAAKNLWDKVHPIISNISSFLSVSGLF